MTSVKLLCSQHMKRAVCQIRADKPTTTMHSGGKGWGQISKQALPMVIISLLISKIHKCDLMKSGMKLLDVVITLPPSPRLLKISKGRGGHIFPLKSELGFQIPLSPMHSKKGQNHGYHRTSELGGALKSIY